MIDIPSDDVVYDPYKDIKPCPFCGGKAIFASEYKSDDDWNILNGHYHRTYMVGCTNCGIYTQEYSEKIKPFQIWQRRVGEME